MKVIKNKLGSKIRDMNLTKINGTNVSKLNEPPILEEKALNKLEKLEESENGNA